MCTESDNSSSKNDTHNGTSSLKFDYSLHWLDAIQFSFGPNGTARKVSMRPVCQFQPFSQLIMLFNSFATLLAAFTFIRL